MQSFSDVKLEIFIPEPFIDKLRQELSRINVGVIGNYDSCISITRVKGYWRPLAGATPFLGEIGEVSEGVEYKVEVNCPTKLVREALATIRALHPYDEPLTNIIPLANHLFK